MARSKTLQVLLAIAFLAGLGSLLPSEAAESPEYRLKAAFLYNFALFTDWPAEIGESITLCVLEGSEFRGELDELQGQLIGARRFAVRRVQDAEATQGCQLVFLPKAPPAVLTRWMGMLAARQHLLTVGDTPEADQAGVGINMTIKDARVTFTVNLKVVQAAGLTLSSKLLRLSQHVR